MKRFSCSFLSIFLSSILALFFCLPVFAAVDWPSDCDIRSEGGIVMDADSGAILYGKNIHEHYYPASITKILTALIVLENSPDLNEIVTFSKNAVYNVEEGSSSAGLSPGDQLSIRDCLYALLLKSANEAGNALAEHIAGNIPQFVEMMNAKAEQLGCVDSHFANPSGLNNPEHYTSAYDMALIAKAAFSNETLTEIASTVYYDLPPLKQYPEGQTVYIGHKMLKKNFSAYYPYAVAGKTGYTSLAGNTLVTYAKKDGMRLVAVVLKGSNPTHYSDTRTLFEFGFQNFKTIHIADNETTYTSLENDLSIAGLSTRTKPLLSLSETDTITIPKAAAFEDTVSTLSYDLTPPYPSTAIAELNYTYQDHFIGRAYLEIDQAMLDGDSTMKPESLETLSADQLPTLENEESLSSDKSSAKNSADNTARNTADAQAPETDDSAKSNDSAIFPFSLFGQGKTAENTDIENPDVQKNSTKNTDVQSNGIQGNALDNVQDTQEPDTPNSLTERNGEPNPQDTQNEKNEGNEQNEKSRQNGQSRQSEDIIQPRGSMGLSSQNNEKEVLRWNVLRLTAIVLLFFFIVGFIQWQRRKRRERQLQEERSRRERRQERLYEAGYTQREFNRLLEERRQRERNLNSNAGKNKKNSSKYLSSRHQHHGGPSKKI
ncbi:MAG: serine hydrolase [bacterium]|nr:serine hydrolase [bacterium]